MPLILLLVCLISTTLGAVAGFSGGVIIKPVLDALGLLPTSTISFCSGCTALAMSISSLIRSRDNGVQVHFNTSTPLALGAVLGGMVGKWSFQLVLTISGREHILSGVQAVLLTVLTIAVFFYVCRKDTLPSLRVENIPVTILIGLCLGFVSAFLGIGGGTNNVAVLFFFFSMDAKEAAKNSIYIIMFSQTSSLISSILMDAVPAFSWSNLLLMIAGGVSGAILGAAISKRLDSDMVERLLRGLLILIIGINIYNIIHSILMLI